MQIIEQFLISKAGNPDGGEDRIFVGNNLIAVIDGATAKTGRRFDGRTPGEVAVDLVMRALLELDEVAHEGAPPLMQVRHLDRAIETWYFQRRLHEEMKTDPAQRCTANMVIYSAICQQLWFVGDCQAILNGQRIQSEKAVDRVTSGARALFLHAEIAKGRAIASLRAEDPGRILIAPLLEQQCWLQNQPAAQMGFPVLDGFLDLQGVQIVSVPPRTEEIVLASDGYPELAATLEESEQELADILREDPLLIGDFKATKGLQPGNVSFDDRAYIRFAL